MRTRRLNLTIDVPVGIRDHEENPELAAKIIVAGFNAQIQMMLQDGDVEKVVLMLDPLPVDAHWVAEAVERPECGTRPSDRYRWVRGVVDGLSRQLDEEIERGTQEG